MLRCAALTPSELHKRAPLILTPYQQSEVEAVTAVDNAQTETQPALDGIATNNHTASIAYVDAQIERWQNIQLTDPGNGDTVGTLGYFAVSARDFWSEIGNAYDAGDPPHVIVGQYDLWRLYASEQAGKPQSERQPIDLWYEEKKFA